MSARDAGERNRLGYTLGFSQTFGFATPRHNAVCKSIPRPQHFLVRCRHGAMRAMLAMVQGASRAFT